MLDSLLTETDRALRVIGGVAQATNPSPARGMEEPDLNANQRELSAALMRVNHAGEVAAQALYRGQAAVTRDRDLAEALRQAGDEEQDHLAWCGARVEQLGGRTSFLTPAWYAGSFLLGAAAGLAGDRASLGFLAETEGQVTRHLDEHLKQLPAEDSPSRRIVAEMREHEIAHGADARERGAADMPRPVKGLMRAAAWVMTTVAHRI
ncbi:MAG: 2-polyprenyl-3-methyl-6-methoxy-1,4-benzoquinone monooxygenase [Gammaproteobacteria bacterium]